jgi:putative flavoprotein involved in K+ transport
MNTNQHSGSTEHFDTVVVGGGQSGLALGYYLARQDRSFVILDERHRVGDAWRQRWDSLRLFTPAKYNGLPGTRFPGDRLAFPTKDQQGDYLQRYAALHALPVRTGMRVDRLWREDDTFVLTCGGRRFLADHVVVATGPWHTPRVPDFASELSRSIVQLHSLDYRGPWQLQPGAVLVVGVGNSGAEIALELSESHQTTLAGKETAQLPVRHGRAAARFAFPLVRFIGMHVLTVNTPVGRKARPRFVARGTPLIRTRRQDLAEA